ncbi:ComF family protein [Salinifilum aidingensis]
MRGNENSAGRGSAGRGAARSARARPRLLDLVLPVNCAGCGRQGTHWCLPCAGELSRPHRVRLPVLGQRPPVYALGVYRGAARRAVLAYKERGRRVLAGVFAERLAAGVRFAHAGPGPWWIVPAPSRWWAARRRGGAHMLRVARELARRLRADGCAAEVLDCLRLGPGAVDAARLAHADRPANLSGRLRARPPRRPPPGGVLLVDDVITTGATVAESAAVLDGVRCAPELVLSVTAVDPRAAGPGRPLRAPGGRPR